MALPTVQAIASGTFNNTRTFNVNLYANAGDLVVIVVNFQTYNVLPSLTIIPDGFITKFDEYSASSLSIGDWASNTRTVVMYKRLEVAESSWTCGTLATTYYTSGQWFAARIANSHVLRPVDVNSYYTSEASTGNPTAYVSRTTSKINSLVLHISALCRFFSGATWSPGSGCTVVGASSDNQIYVQSRDAATTGSYDMSVVQFNGAVHYTALVVQGNDSYGGAIIDQMYVDTAWYSTAPFAVTQLTVDVAAVYPSEARVTQQVLEILHSIAQARQHTTDTLAQATVAKTYKTNTLLRDTVYLTHKTDTVVADVHERWHTTDAYYLNRVVYTHTTDIVNAMVQGQSHYTNSYTIWRPTHWHTTDIYYQNFVIRTHTTDSRLYSSPFVTHSTDVLQRATTIQVHATDTVKADLKTQYHTTDVDRKGSNTETFTTDTAMKWVNEKSHYTDFLAKAVGYLQQYTDVSKRGSNYLTHNTDTIALRSGIKIHLADADLKGGVTKTFTTDTMQRLVVTVGHSTDTLRKQADITRSHDTDAVVKYVGILPHYTDTLRLAKVGKTHNTDLLALSVNERLHTTDMKYLYVGFVSHTSDVLQLAKVSKTHDTDVLQLAEVEVSHTADTMVERFVLINHTTDLVTLASTLVAHNTDVFMLKPVGPAVSKPRKFTFVDDYGTIYTVIWQRTGQAPLDSIDITTITEQPYVWGERASGRMEDRNLYRRGVVTIERSILDSTDDGYVRILHGVNQYVGDVLTTFNCSEPPINPFRYMLSNAMSDQAQTWVDDGVCYLDAQDTADTVWPDVDAQGNVLPADSGKRNLEFIDVWH